MNTQINKIIKEYLNRSDVDFALLINGTWGCGKTYYVNNEMRSLIEKSNKQIIYTSLNGYSDFNRLKRRITFQLLYRNKSVDQDLIDGLFEIGDNIPRIGSAFKILKTAKDLIESKKIESVDISETVFVFDDLERISERANTKDFIGQIYENYTKKGGKTIFVADEKNIRDEDYHRIKEKTIRTTIQYTPDHEKQLANFLAHFRAKNKNVNITEMQGTFIELLKKLEIRNIRTVSFVLDNFQTCISVLNKEQTDKYGKFIFENIGILTSEVTLGELTTKNLVDKKELDRITSNPFFWDLHNKKEEEKTYVENFYEHYNQSLGLQYIFFESLFDYILTGYFDQEKFVKELEYTFESSKKPEEEAAIDFLGNFRELEHDQLKYGLENLVKFLEEGVYHLSKLPHLYTMLCFFKEREYLVGWKWNIEDIINRAFQKSEQDTKKIPAEIDLEMGFHVFDERQKNNDFYKELIKRIRDKSEEKKFDNRKEKVNIIFDKAKKNERFIDDLREYEHSKLFGDIVETGATTRFFDLSNKGIHDFEAYLYSEILQISNAGQYGSSQKEPLQEIVRTLSEGISNSKYDSMRVKRFEELIDYMSRAIAHLEKTKSG